MAKAKRSTSLTAAVSAEIKSSFDLGKFKDKKGLTGSVKFKPQQWVPLSPAFQEVTSVPGIPTGHIVLFEDTVIQVKLLRLLKQQLMLKKQVFSPYSLLLR